MSSAIRLHGPSRQPSTASTASALAAASTPQVGTSTPSAAQQYRRLIWEATLPIVVSVESETLPLGSLDRTIETHYAKAARISYLPLLLQEVKSTLLPLMIDDDILQNLKEDSFWFSYQGVPLRWHWPVGLLYDFHTANTCPTSHRSSLPVASLTNAMRRLSTTPIDAGTSSPSSDMSTVASSSCPSNLPWHLVLHIGNAPLDKLHSAPGLDHCRTAFMSQLKEADFVRWGSTKRVTNLRKMEQDALWDGVITHNYDTYWSVASKIIPPLPLSDGSSSSIAPIRTPLSHAADSLKPPFTQQVNESQTSLQSAAPSESGVSTTESTTGGRSSNTHYRSIPMRFYLVQGAPTVQEPVAPYNEDGRANTLHSVLSAIFPLLLPPVPTFTTLASQASPPPPLAYAVIQGIRIPFEAEIPWISSALSSADGWIAVCIHLLAEGERP